MKLPELPGDTPCSLIVGSGEWTLDELRARLGDQEPEFVTTAQAHDLWPIYSRAKWARLAADGEIDGAWQEGEGSPWNLPVPACRAYIKARQAYRSSTKDRRKRRGPWKTTP